MDLRIALLGCGNVGRAFLAMIAEKADALRSEHDLTLLLTGALTRSAGAWTAPDGATAADVVASGWPRGAAPAGTQPFAGDALAFAQTCPADVLVELTTLNPHSGQPALDHMRAALAAGKHVVTANKGPIAYGYAELRDLARQRGVALRFESTVMDGTPIFNMVEAALPATEIRGFRGLLNSTSNYMLSRMGDGDSLEQALVGAQHLGIAEADPSYDLDGWDASVKATVLTNVLLGANLRPPEVRREGLGAQAMRDAQAGLAPGETLKQVVEARREQGQVVAQVRLVALPPTDLFARLSGMETALCLHTDTMGDLTLVEGEGGPGQTALGVLADLVAIGRQMTSNEGAASLPR